MRKGKNQRVQDERETLLGDNFWRVGDKVSKIVLIICGAGIVWIGIQVAMKVAAR